MKSKETKITYWDGVKRGFKGILNFEGTSGVKEYFSYISMLFVLTVVLFILTFRLVEISNEHATSVVEGFFWGFTVLSLAATFRRFQDIGKSGLLAFVIPAAFYFTIIISNHPFEWSQIVYYACVGIITYCVVLLMQRRREEKED